MAGITDRSFLGFGHKKDEDKVEHEQVKTEGETHEGHQHGAHGVHGEHGEHGEHGGGTQQQPMRPTAEGYATTDTYSAAPGVPPSEGEGQKHGFMEKIEGVFGMDKAKKGHKKGGDDGSSSSSSDEEGEGKQKKHGMV